MRYGTVCMSQPMKNRKMMPEGILKLKPATQVCSPAMCPSPMLTAQAWKMTTASSRLSVSGKGFVLLQNGTKNTIRNNELPPDQEA